MARAKKEQTEQTEQTTEQPEVEKSPEQVAIAEAIENDTLQELHDAEGTPDDLKTLIVVYQSLLGALGAEAGATIAARTNLESFQPKKVKAKKAPKEKAFNEVKALKDAMGTETPLESLATLVEDERISEDLKNAIITYTTLAGLTLPEGILEAAWATLGNFGRKGKARTQNPSGPREHFKIEVDGVTYDTLTGAIRAQGIGKEEVTTASGKVTTGEDLAWRKIRGPLIAKGEVEYEGKTYKKVAVEPQAETAQEAESASTEA